MTRLHVVASEAPATDAPDDELAAGVRRNDPEALAALVRRESPRVVGILRRILGPQHDFDDLVQTVFLEMCRSLSNYRGDGSLSAFITGIAVRVARRAMRPSAWTRHSQPLVGDAPAPEAPADRAVTSSEQVTRLRAAIDKLAPKKRVALLLWVDGMEIELIAESLEIPVGTAKSRIAHARKELEAHALRDPYLRELFEGVDRDR